MGDGGKGTVLSFAELMQCVGVHNLRHSWDNALDSYPGAAHRVLPAPTGKTSDKVTLCRTCILFTYISRPASSLFLVRVTMKLNQNVP